MIDAFYAFLEKLGYPHPLHPLFTHLPVGLVTGALLFGLTAWLGRRPALWRTARHCIILALIFLVPTALIGYMGLAILLWRRLAFFGLFKECVLHRRLSGHHPQEVHQNNCEGESEKWRYQERKTDFFRFVPVHCVTHCFRQN